MPVNMIVGFKTTLASSVIVTTTAQPSFSLPSFVAEPTLLVPLGTNTELPPQWKWLKNSSMEHNTSTPASLNVSLMSCALSLTMHPN